MLKKELTPVHFSKVTIDGPFWAQRTKINREQTIPRLYMIYKNTGRIDSLKLDWSLEAALQSPAFGAGDIYSWLSPYFGPMGVTSWIEAASYSLTTHPDSKLDSLIDEVVDLFVKRQQPDGYMPGRLNVDPERRWTNLRDGGLSGGLFEAGVAHFQATGKRKLLDVACRNADYIDTVFGREPGKKRGYPGHEGIEMALFKLYRVTGEKRYANLAKFFIDERGQQPHYYDIEAIERGDDPTNFYQGTYEYNQSHKPVREQTEAVGHAVRAMYLYSAMADVAAEFGDEELRAALDRLWDNLTSAKMYITGGVGTTRQNEGFTKDYDLPNETAYAETCAAIGLAFLAHRMLQFECDGRYADVMERVLHNGFISGVSLDGKKFFYDNPLTSLGWSERMPWFYCPCCPPNLMRTLASLGNYVYSQSKTDAIVHLYAGGTASLQVAGQKVGLRVDTRYPWDGEVVVTMEPEAPASFGLKLRIPAWCPEFSLKVNGREVKSIKPQRGYIRIEREWKAGDRVELNLSMPIELVKAHPNVLENAGCVAIQRGPIVYCLEQMDNLVPPQPVIPPEDRRLANRIALQRIVLPRNTKLEAHFEPDLLDGVVVIQGDALYNSDWDPHAITPVPDSALQLYRVAKEQRKPFKIKAVPYFAWANRGGKTGAVCSSGEMRVWIRSDA